MEGVNEHQTEDKQHFNNRNQVTETVENSELTTNQLTSSTQQTEVEVTQANTPTPSNPKLAELVKELPKSDSIEHNVWINKVSKQRASYSQVVARSTMKAAIPSINIPTAIASKLKFRNTAFFRSFLQDRNTQPDHQKEFNSLLNIAIEKYKRKYNILLVNKNNRDQIYNKLRKKLAINTILSLNLPLLEDHVSAQHIYYLINFGKIESTMEFEQARKTIGKYQSENRQELPDKPEDVPIDITEFLLFTLPIEDNNRTAAIVKAMRLIFNFGQLPNAYFVTVRTPLPRNPAKLKVLNHIFPLRDRSRLAYLAEYHRELRKIYILQEKLPSTYFDLPLEKIDLPSIPQALRAEYRNLFSCKPKNEMEFKSLIEQLRRVYRFKKLPNDYIIQKKQLPTEPL
ncbi:25943_t:CDS:2 [Dentiscutata erythropus]|uniref:25943_t:CDS:1 n=1 Tax=Dentiscutata erythropus TaxID=1348616 RepID=A0A9N9ERE0_9GLOM|nr:25943_t:CDS:2 [Dentiscutata erythropus]